MQKSCSYEPQLLQGPEPSETIRPPERQQKDLKTETGKNLKDYIPAASAVAAITILAVFLWRYKLFKNKRKT